MLPHVTNIDVPFMPEALNESGTMVGWTSTPDVGEVPVVVSNTGQLTYLDNIAGGVAGHAYDVNDSGYIVGVSSCLDWHSHACVWHGGVNTVDLGTFGGTWSYAEVINNAGQVAGVYGDDSGAIGDFVWSPNADTVFIPTFPQLDEGSFFGPIDMNDNGVVLGGAEINGMHTVVTWSLAGGFTVVGTGEARAINNSGWIVGSPDMNSTQAIVWQPVPEPSSLLALVCGITGLGALKRKTSMAVKYRKGESI